MAAKHELPPAQPVREALLFMRQNLAHRAMLSDMLDADLERWDTLSLEEQRQLFDRQRRRFAMACPSLAGWAGVVATARPVRRRYVA